MFADREGGVQLAGVCVRGVGGVRWRFSILLLRP